MKESNFYHEFHTFAEKVAMTTSKLKKALIQRISEIEDQSFLEAIKTILDAKAASQAIQVPPEIVSRILASRKEIDQGMTVDNDLLEKEIEAWLNER